jgi:hypothetical protein
MDEQALRKMSTEVLTDIKEWRRAHPRATYVEIENEPIGSDKPRSLLVLLILTVSNHRLVVSKHISRCLVHLSRAFG